MLAAFGGFLERKARGKDLASLFEDTLGRYSAPGPLQSAGFTEINKTAWWDLHLVVQWLGLEDASCGQKIKKVVLTQCV